MLLLLLVVLVFAISQRCRPRYSRFVGLVAVEMRVYTIHRGAILTTIVRYDS